MEYEVFYGCNIVGALVVFLILVYHLISSRPLKTIEDDLVNTDVSVISRKSQ